MKKLKKLTAMLLALMMLLALCPASALAEEANTPKEEVVYIRLDADGTVKEIHVVNIFDLSQDGTILDYGDYSELRNMTTTDPIAYSDDTVRIQAKAGKLYYEGRLTECAMPWNISIRYFMDGTEYPAEEIAGKSGRLEIRLSVAQNPDCDSAFFDGYALQASITLNTELAANITAEGATIANVGKNKQLTYTILPHTEKEISVTADVKDFEMSAIAINGIRMNLDMHIDAAGITERVDEITGAVSRLNTGAAKLNTGAGVLYAASGNLNTAASELHSGVATLDTGAGELKTGLATLVARNEELTAGAWTAYEGLCAAAEAQLNAQLAASGLGTVTLTPDTYEAVLSAVLMQLDADAVRTQASKAALAEVTAQVEAQADALYAGYVQSQADAIFLAYIQSQADAVYAQGAAQAVLQQLLADGMAQAQAEAYLQTQEGQALVTGAAAKLTDLQKEQLLQAAAASLTDEQRAQILQGACTALTEEQKAEIRSGYIAQMMDSETVTAQLGAAVAQASAAAAQIAALKAQLDNYGAFYNGLVEYVTGAASAAGGASELAGGLDTLYANTATLKSSVASLYTAVGTLRDGTASLKDGTQAFADQTADLNTEVSDEISTMVTAMMGSDVETKSFASGKNVNIQSVQFVLQTEAIETAAPVDTAAPEEEPLSFWQKLLNLF